MDTEQTPIPKKKIVCISDTHYQHSKMTIPDGDILIHAGDISWRGEVEALMSFNAWGRSLPHKYKIFIAGNHDFIFEKDPSYARRLIPDWIYLEDSEVTVDGIRVWGSPWQPWFHDWAFNLFRGPEIREKWDQIPDGIDILVTHGPPVGICDKTTRGQLNVGCADLREAVNRVRPKLHVFGHIHEAYGQDKVNDTIFVNASSCDLVQYAPINPPIIVELDL